MSDVTPFGETAKRDGQLEDSAEEQGTAQHLWGFSGETILAVISSAAAEDIGWFRNDWTGNGIEVEAVADPKVQGVTCHISRFSRSVIDRLSKGSWFIDPSNSSIACHQTGPMTISDINTSPSGEEVFSERLSLIFKSLAIRRIYDKKNMTLIYLT